MIRSKDDLRNDKRCGFSIVTARDLDILGMKGVVDTLKERVGDTRVYISVDIDVLDPAFAPGKSQAYLPWAPRVLSPQPFSHFMASAIMLHRLI
jgi:Arginase family